MRLEIGDTIEKYVVEDFLGEGGFGAVYLVRHTLLDAPFALKVIAHPSPTEQQRLLREADVQSGLHHPNIVRVHDVVETDGAKGLVMEWVRGPSLDQVLLACRPTLEQIDLIVRRILQAMAHAHREGAIHRDLKPANVLIDQDDGHLIPRVTDFGLVKRLDDTEGPTRTGAAVGTPMYMAPEQIRSAKTVDARADVFSLGVLLYELVTGERPFQGEDMVRLCADATAERYRPVADVVFDLPDRMVDAITHALRGDREDRPVDAAALLDLWAAGTPEPVLGPGDWSPITEGIERLRLQKPVPPRVVEGEDPEIAVEPPPPERWRTGVAAFVGAALAMLLLGIPLLVVLTGFFGLGSVALWNRAPVETPALTPAPPPVVVEAPAAEAPVEPPATPAAQVPSAPTTGQIEVEGHRAVFVRGTERIGAGTGLPPGTWELWVFFSADAPDLVGNFSIEAGEHRTVQCFPEMLHCRWKE